MTARRLVILSIVLAILPLVPVAAEQPLPPPINFNQQIRPILSDRCFKCHGPDAKNQESDFRLDNEQNAKADLGGTFGIVAGDLGQSELHHRIHATDPDKVMPPPDSNLSLNSQEVALLDQWIRDGARYDRHWAFKKPLRPALPQLTPGNQSWVRNGIDWFIAHRLEQEELPPAPVASKETLIRRVTLDLTGLPPTPEEVNAFLADPGENAYVKLVDRLLDSPHYGERMALVWLDAARYADSGGYQNDVRRTQWPWRDWVIDAYNENLPFDQFTIQQLAGDLLPHPTETTRLATAFNRNHRINNEGGIIPEEFQVEYVADRVETTATVWMGLTVGCARCHDHKYDPIPQKDFYRLFAFFNTIPERGRDGETSPRPNMAVYRAGKREELQDLERQLSRAKEQQRAHVSMRDQELDAWIGEQSERKKSPGGAATIPRATAHYPFDFPDGRTLPNVAAADRPARAKGNNQQLNVNRPGKHGQGIFIRSGGYVQLGKLTAKAGYHATQPMTWSLWIKPGKDVNSVEGPILSCMTADKRLQGYQLVLHDSDPAAPYRLVFRLTRDRSVKDGLEVRTAAEVPRNSFTHIAVSYDGSLQAAGVQLYLDGKPVPAEIVLNRLSQGFTVSEQTLLGAQNSKSAQAGIRDEQLRNATLDELFIHHRVLAPPAIAALFQLSSQDYLLGQTNLTKPQRRYLKQAYFSDKDPEYQTLKKNLAQLGKSIAELKKNHATYVSIMKEMAQPRKTYLLQRGQYDRPDKSEQLRPATFSALPPPPAGTPRNRLGLAQWLVHEDHPLTARVAVNRYWQMYFGTGLVKTSEDFGAQGDPPSHPNLIDWLAVQFRESGWDIKAMQKLILTSATYRQDSRVAPSLLERDPQNRLLARGPRFRLSGQTLRDQALAVAGLLVRRLGGRPVMPYQPAGLWEEVSAKGYKYVEASGQDLYRRSLYTFWRRTVPPPSMMNFDSAGREACSVKRNRTNTPLQAMNLMNDPQFVEAARWMATRMIREGGPTVADQIRYGHRLVLARPPSVTVMTILSQGYDDYRATFASRPKSAKALLDIGKTAVDTSVDPVELAALTTVASIILNLDETVTKE